MFCDSTPRLYKIYYDTGGWSQLTIQKNIEAVPYCTSETDLKEVKKLVAYYQQNYKQTGLMGNKSVNLLKYLDAIADKRIKELPYLRTANRITELHKVFGAAPDPESWNQTIKESSEGIRSSEKDIHTLTQTIALRKKQGTSCSDQLSTLKDLIQAAKKAAQKDCEDIAPDTTASSSSTPEPALQSPENLFQDPQRIITLKQAIPTMNYQQLTELIDTLSALQVSIEAQLADHVEEMKWLNRSLDLAHRNLARWTNLKQQFEGKITDLASTYIPTKSDDRHVALDEINPDGTQN